MGLFKDSLTVGVMRMALTGIIFLTDLVVSRYVGVFVKGEYFFLVSLILILGTLFTAGLHLGNLYYARQRPLAELAANSLLYLALLAVALFGLGYPLLGFLPTLASGGFWLQTTFLSCLLAECAFALFLNLFVAAGQLFQYALVRIVNRGLMLACMAVAWWRWPASLELLLGVHLLTLLLALLTMARLFPREEDGVGRRFRVRWQSLRQSLGYGLPSQGMVMVDLGVQRLNIILLGFWASPRENGLYSVALNFGQALWLLANALIVVVQSRVRRTPEEQLADLEKLSRHSLALMIGGAVVLALTADSIIGWGYGRQFQPAADLLRAMLPGLAVYSLYVLVSSFLVTNGMAVTAMCCALGGLAVNVGLAAWLIPREGGLGAARALSWGYIASVGLLLAALSRTYPVRWRSLLLVHRSDFLTLRDKFKNLSQKFSG